MLPMVHQSESFASSGTALHAWTRIPATAAKPVRANADILQCEILEKSKNYLSEIIVSLEHSQRRCAGNRRCDRPVVFRKNSRKKLERSSRQCVGCPQTVCE